MILDKNDKASKVFVLYFALSLDKKNEPLKNRKV